MFSLFLFSKYVDDDDFDPREKARFRIWYLSDFLEASITFVLLIQTLNMQPGSGLFWQNFWLFWLAFLVTIETISVYKYFENPLMELTACIVKIIDAIRSIKF